MIDQVCDRFQMPAIDRSTPQEQMRAAAHASAIEWLTQLRAEIEARAKQVHDAWGDSVAFQAADDGLAETIQMLEAGL